MALGFEFLLTKQPLLILKQTFLQCYRWWESGLQMPSRSICTLADSTLCYLYLSKDPTTMFELYFEATFSKPCILLKQGITECIEWQYKITGSTFESVNGLNRDRATTWFPGVIVKRIFYGLNYNPFPCCTYTNNYQFSFQWIWRCDLQVFPLDTTGGPFWKGTEYLLGT